MLPLTTNATLIVIDVQQGFDDPAWGNRNNPQAEAKIAELLDAWRFTQRPLIHIQHLSLEPNSPLEADSSGSQFKAQAQPRKGETIIQKHVNSAFIGTDLEAYLRSSAIDTLVIVGLTTDHCVSTTARMAGNLGFHTFVASDATATFERTGYDGKKYSAQEVHDVSLASLHQEFATVVDTKTLLNLMNNRSHLL